MKVLLNVWSPFLLSHVGEFSSNFYFLALRDQFPDIDFCMPPRVAVLAANAKYAIQKAGECLPWHRMPARIVEEWLFFKRISYLPPRYVETSGADVVLSYGSDPWPFGTRKVGRVQYSHMASEAYYDRAGLSYQLAAEISAKRRVLQPADIVICRDPASTERVRTLLQVPERRLRCIPLYSPNIEPIEGKDLAQKHRTGSVVNVLFVGSDGVRKGLLNLLRAWNSLDTRARAGARLTVVTNMRKEYLSLFPEDARVVPGPIAPSRVKALMREAHVFILPTHYDSYGRVVVEAVSNGCCVITSRQDPQDWMVDYGKAGILVQPASVEEIRAALEQATGNRSLREEMATKAWQRFVQVFHHRVVAVQLYDALRDACQGR